MALKSRSAALLLVPVLSIGLLSGCANRPSLAAQVGDTKITVGQLGKIIDECVTTSNTSDTLQDSATPTETMVLGNLVLIEVAAQASDAIGFPTTQSELDELINSDSDYQQLAKNPNCELLVDSLAKYALISVQAQTDSDFANNLANQMTKIEVTINPMYGAWTPGLGISLAKSGSLSTELNSELEEQR